MIKKKFRQLKVLFEDLFLFIKMRFFEKYEDREKVLFVNFKNPNLYHRFFYLLLKYYQLGGYQIVYPMSFSKFRNLRNGDRYLSLILREEGFLTINKKNLKKKYIEISDHHFSADYFKNYFEEKNTEKNSFHIPMTFHPLMYHYRFWDMEIAPKNRINSIFCYGNFDDKAYLEIEKTGFKVINRRKLYDVLRHKKNFKLVENHEDLSTIFTSKPSEMLVFAEKYIYPLPMDKVRETLSYFRYFLCCPGVVMPLCHNVIEAMSVGTIPLIQKEYAEVMYPNLEHKKNAIIFKDLEELEKLLNNEIFNISEKDVSLMSQNVLNYYKQHLQPDSVVSKINRHIPNCTIYLNAEHRSVKFLSLPK